MAKVDFKPKNFLPYRKFTQLFTARTLEWYYGTFRYKPLKIIGRESVPEGQFLIVSNHLSVWDPPMLVMATMKPMGLVAKEELFDSPRLGPIIEFLCAVSVNRDKPDRATIRSVKKIFEAGWSLGMFVEGTRAKTPGVLGRPHLGAAYFARSNKVPILPVGIVGTETKGGPATITVGKPFEPTHDLEETTWKIMEEISKLTGFEIKDRELAKAEAEAE